MIAPRSYARRAVLYTRPACPLCFALRRAAVRSARRHGLDLSIVDVSGDAALLARYGDEVPVLDLPDGRSIGGRATAAEVEAAFRALDPRGTGRAWTRRLFRMLGLAGGAPR